MAEEGTLDATNYDYVSSDSLTVVVLRRRDQRIRGVGVSIKHPDDEPDYQLGFDLAIGRAFQDLGWNVEQDALRRAGVRV